MTARHRLLPLVALAVALSGCFQMSSVLTVRPDGSATLRDEVTLSGFALLALEEAASEEGKASGEMFDRTMFEDRAAGLGADVEVASVEAGADGYVVTYAVPDVRGLRYSPPSIPDDGEDDGPVADNLDLSFLFEPGDPAVLRVMVPKPRPDEGKPDADAADDAGDPDEAARMIGMLRSFFGDARMTVAVAVEGTIVETNAAFADGSTVTLFDLPFAAVFDVMAEDPTLASTSPDDAAMMERLAEVEGVSLETPGTVRVAFR